MKSTRTLPPHPAFVVALWPWLEYGLRYAGGATWSSRALCGSMIVLTQRT